MGEDDLLLLDKASKYSYYQEDVRDLLERIRDGDIVLWKLKDDTARGLVGTRLIERKTGLELWIELLVGTGFLSRAGEIREAIHELAHRAEATRVSGFAVRPGLARLYEKVLKVPPAATVFTEELPDGRRY